MNDQTFAKNSVASPSEAPIFVEPWTLARGVKQALQVGVLVFCSLGLYLTVLKWRGPAAVFTTQTVWDDWLPFWPEWVWVYLLPYLIAPVVIAALSRRTFRWLMPRALAVVLLTLLIFILVPTQTGPRPSAADLNEGLTAKLYHDMVEIDEPPANAAPSLHVSLTFLLAWALLKDFPRWWPASCLGTVVVWLSTLVTRQHHVLDVASGALVALVIGLAWGPAFSDASEKRSDPNASPKRR